ncbi:MAG: hypothetical protein PHI49_10800 [Halothiobacillaceae bacterium]|nr:hypothetical protein [Halothiobacillaceae bacterium]
MNDRELANEIAKSAQYIKEMLARQDWFTVRYIEPGAIETKRDEIKRRLEDIEAKAQALCDAIMPLHAELTVGMIQLGRMHSRISAAWDAALQASVEVTLAARECLPPPRSRAMRGQKTAARLAHAMVGTTTPRQVRDVARKIIMAAELELPDERSLSTWINEFRQEDAAIRPQMENSVG